MEFDSLDGGEDGEISLRKISEILATQDTFSFGTKTFA